MAAANGVIDYFDALDAHHGGEDDSERPRRYPPSLKALKPLISRHFEYIETRNDVHSIGPSDPTLRVATISFVVPHMAASSISQKLANKASWQVQAITMPLDYLAKWALIQKRCGETIVGPLHIYQT